MFNKNFYVPTNYTREQAENILIENGFFAFSFVNVSRSNGTSFYYVLPDNRNVRISDHPLTGKRQTEYIQLFFYKPKSLGVNKKPRT